MIRILLLGLLLNFFAVDLLCQTAKLTIHIKDGTESSIELATFGVYDFFIKDKPFGQDMQLRLDQGQVSKDFVLPGMLRFQLQLPNRRFYSRGLYLEPGDDLHILLDKINGKDSLLISGRGAANNQYLDKGRAVEYADYYIQDTLPNRIWKDIVEETRKNQIHLEQYIARYNPSPAFIRIEQLNLHYYPATAFFIFYSNHKYALRKRENYESLNPLWVNKKDSLLKAIDIQNPQGLVSNVYQSLLRYYPLRRKEELWAVADKEAMLAKYYAHYPAGQRMEVYNADNENQFKEAIINTEFSGEVNEYLYTVLFSDIIRSKKTNAAAIFDRFAQRYPDSRYMPYLAPIASTWRANENRKLNDKMVLMADTGQYQSFDELLATFKGKTILIDMWGTWCGPCHEEIERNSAALKQHFKDKDILFLYIANNDESRMDTWKKMIAYYNLEGTHILANRRLSDSIVKTTGLKGYPTYIVVRSDGTFELSKAGFPMKREILIRQIEDAVSSQAFNVVLQNSQ